MKNLNYLMIFLAGVLVVGCGAGKTPNVDLIQDMMETQDYKALEYDPQSASKSSARVPPEGTVKRGFSPYAYVGDAEGAEAQLKNPIEGDLSPEVVVQGKKLFDTYCLVCHGPRGGGDGPVAAKMPLKPPTLLSAKVRGFRDGRIYHIISQGQGVMMDYSSQIAAKDRWAVVNYVRSLQKASNE